MLYIAGNGAHVHYHLSLANHLISYQSEREVINDQAKITIICSDTLPLYYFAMTRLELWEQRTTTFITTMAAKSFING
ncbi:hypothetical protein DdX_05144 [Ditylenchus destructor]|uniref:Uncharacterized protein n=1 Tax=Ditylenchus destructor TaxID=166010 RepID=A0AAD4R7E3_9BILA|nr:hypothetical protein DdX_05144 [Ditylenchus destructor]